MSALADFSNFIGTENYYRHSLFRSFNYTDAVKFMAESYKAYWLIDACFSHGFELYKKYGADSEKCQFIIFKLTKKDNGAILAAEDGNNKVIARQEITYTDFPEKEFILYFQNGVLFHPNEY